MSSASASAFLIVEKPEKTTFTFFLLGLGPVQGRALAFILQSHVLL